MELLSDAGEFVHRGSTQSVPVPVLMFLSHYAYEDAGPPETDTGSNGIRGGGTESACLCAEVDVGRAEDTASSVLAAAYASARILGGINREWVEAVSFEGTDIGTDEMVHIVMRYRMRLPFSVLGINSIPVEQVCSRRMWNGADGGRFGGGGRDGDGEDDETVYIGKNSTRYHRLRTCHYLYNDLKAVDFGTVGELRNESGRRYSPCGTCGAGSGSTGKGGTGSGSMGSAGTVYVMPYGTSYHLSKSCRSIIAYVQAVPLSQVEYFGECSYCRGK